MSNHSDELIEREKGVASNLRGNVLSLRAEGEQLNKIEMIGQVFCFWEERGMII